MKQLLIAACILLYAAGASAQKGIPVLEFDFNKGVFKDGDYIKSGKIQGLPIGSFVIIRVTNVNTFRYKVTISGKNIEYVTPVPSELQNIFRLPKTSEGNDKTSDAKTAAGAASNEMKQLKDLAANNAVAERNKMSNNQNLALTESLTTAATNADEFAKAMQALSDACKEYVTILGNLASIKFTRTALINIAIQDWPNREAMQNNRPAELSNAVMRQSFDRFSEYYAKAKALYNKALLLAPDNNVKKTISEALKEIETSYYRIEEERYLSLIGDVITLQDAMNLTNNFTVVSSPVQINGDAAYFEVAISPEKTSNLQNITSGKTFALEGPTKGGLKVDFSVGPVFSFGNNAKDDLYFLQPYNKDSVSLMSRPNNNAVTPGIGAFLHAYARSGTGTSFGGCFGVGAGFDNFDNIKASFYLGGTAIFGKRQKLMLSTGVSFLRVDRLKDKQYETRLYKNDEVKIGDITERVFKSSFFLSVSYNLTNRVEVK